MLLISYLTNISSFPYHAKSASLKETDRHLLLFSIYWALALELLKNRTEQRLPTNFQLISN